MAHKMIDPEDERLIHTVIGPQLKGCKQVRISLPIWATFNIDYGFCMFDKRNMTPIANTIVMPTGFGCGWKGTAMLGYYLARMGHRVLMVSLPGCGNSSDPPSMYYKTEGGFQNEAEVLAKFMKEIIPGEKAHLVGHSMAASIITELAYSNPELVASLTLLCPAGFEKRGAWELLGKFVLNGLLHWKAFRNDPVWAKLCEFLPAEKSTLAPNRWPQRISEWKRLCYSNDLILILQRIADQIPVECIWAEKDSVFPEEKSSIAEFLKNVHMKRLPLYHNVTMFESERTANEINDFITRSWDCNAI